MTDRPHFIERNGELVPASTEEIVPVVMAHVNHHGIAYFSDCAECVAARVRGEYPHWFPDERST